MNNPFDIIMQRLERIEILISSQPKPLIQKDKEEDIDLIKIDEAALITGYKKNYIYELSSKGEIPVVRRQKGRGIRFSKKELEDWMNAGRPSVTKEVLKSLTIK